MNGTVNDLEVGKMVMVNGKANSDGSFDSAIKAPDNFLFKLSDQRIIILVNCTDGKNEELGSVILSSYGLRLLLESGESTRKMFLVAPLLK